MYASVCCYWIGEPRLSNVIVATTAVVRLYITYTYILVGMLAMGTFNQSSNSYYNKHFITNNTMAQN